MVQRSKRKVQVSTRVTPDLMRRFERVAAKNDRSVAAELRRLVMAHVEKNGTSR